MPEKIADIVTRPGNPGELHWECWEEAAEEKRTYTANTTYQDLPVTISEWWFRSQWESLHWTPIGENLWRIVDHFDREWEMYKVQDPSNRQKFTGSAKLLSMGNTIPFAAVLIIVLVPPVHPRLRVR